MFMFAASNVITLRFYHHFTDNVIHHSFCLNGLFFFSPTIQKTL